MEDGYKTCCEDAHSIYSIQGTLRKVSHLSKSLVIILFFKKMGQSRPLFVYFRHFLITISIIEKNIDGVLGIRTRGRRMVGADETTELVVEKDFMTVSGNVGN